MKQYQTDNGVCGACGFTMLRDRKNAYYSQITCECTNPDCPEYKIKYCSPSIVLKKYSLSHEIADSMAYTARILKENLPSES